MAKLLKLLFLLILALMVPGFKTLHAQDFSDVKNLKPFSYAGTIEARGMFYGASGIANRRAPFTYYLSGSPTINIYGIQIPVSFAISESDQSFSQPFNQYGLSPTYKWITLHAGYRNVSFSPYTLGGHTMLGAGFELNPGKLRVGFMYGRLNKATTIDTASQALVPFSFSRKGYAAKLGYGSPNNFFEFSYLSAKDDEDTKPINLPNQLELVSPAKNNVAGYSFKFTFLKNMFIESTGALSLYTSDINSPLKIDSIKNDFLQKAKNVFVLNGTSEYYTALSGGLGYREKNYGIKINYKRIEPDFKTMGAYFFNSDLENWTISPNVSVFKGKLRVNGSIGFQHDNLKKQKRAENKRLIASGNANIEITKSLGLDLIYTNFSDNQTPQTALFADSLRIIQTTQTMGIMPRYFWSTPNATHILSGSANLSTLKDFNTFFSAQAASRDINTKQFFLNYNLVYPKRKTSVFANLNYTNLKGQNLQNSFTGLTFGGNKTFLKDKMQTNLSLTLTKSDNNMSSDSFITNATGNLAYRLSKNQRVGLNIFLTNNKSKSINLLQPNFTETRAELSYQFNF